MIDLAPPAAARLSATERRALLAHLLARRRGDEPVLPLSFAEERLWFFDQLAPGDPAFNIPVAGRLDGPLDVEAFERALNTIVRRHEVLRTSYWTLEGEPVRLVAPEAPLRVEHVDLRALPAAEREPEAVRRARERGAAAFDLRRPPLLRVTLYRLDAAAHVVAVTAHHIVFDGVSAGVFFGELLALYGACVEGRPDPLPALALQYGDYARAQRRALRGDALEEALAFWRGQLLPEPAPLGLGTGPRSDAPAAPSPGARAVHVLPPALSTALAATAQRERATPFMVILAAFALVLRWETGRSDLVVGTDAANRLRPETQTLLGFFVNQLALRVRLAEARTFAELLRRVRTTCLAAYQHQDVPFERVVSALKPASRGRTPFFTVKMTTLGPRMPLVQLGALRLTPLEIDPGTAQTDLVVFVDEAADGMVTMWQYDARRLEASTVARLGTWFGAVLARVTAEPDVALGELQAALAGADAPVAVAQRERLRGSFARFRAARRSDAGPAGPVWSRAPDGPALPAVVEVDVAAAMPLGPWVDANIERIDAVVRDTGAVLLRGFAWDGAAGFERVAGRLCGPLVTGNGEHERTAIAEGVYTPVGYRHDRKLLWHHENAFNARWPLRISFACVAPASVGGETPLADGRRVLGAIDAALREEFERKGVMYVRTYGGGVGREWQAIFGTARPGDVEAACRRDGLSFEWLSDGRLRTRCIRPAVMRHPHTGERSWFNQAPHWHTGCLDAVTRDSLVAAFGADGLPRECRFGDGTPIPDDAMAHVLAVYARLEVVFPWRAGDVLVVDNVLVAHARNPYAGERRLLIAMGTLSESGEQPDAEAC